MTRNARVKCAALLVPRSAVSMVGSIIGSFEQTVADPGPSHAMPKGYMGQGSSLLCSARPESR